MKKKSSLFITLTIAALTLVTSAFPALAVTPGAVTSTASVKVQFTDNHPKPSITDPQAVKERMAQIEAGMNNTYKKTRSRIAVENFLKSQGMEVVVPVGIAKQDSVAGDVSIYQPAVYYDSSTGLYFFSSTWQWNRQSNGIPSWIYDVPALGGNVGGNDGAGFWLSNPDGITLTETELYTYDYNNNSTLTQTPADWNQYGVAYKAQDTSWVDLNVPGGYNYNWDSGLVGAWATISGNSGTYLKTYLSHNWSSTDISSIGVGLSGITFNVSNSSNEWTGASQPEWW